jgi:hypothetical protein
MSDTPRTDNEAWPRRLYDEEDMSISLGFARTLERELNAAKAEVERLREEINLMRARVVYALSDDAAKKETT